MKKGEQKKRERRDEMILFFFLTLTACVKTSLGSNNFNSITQLAGNRYLSSTSETARKKSFNFEVFNNLATQYFIRVKVFRL